MKVFTTDKDMEDLNKAWKAKYFRLCTSWKQLFLYQQLSMPTDIQTVLEIGRLANRKINKNGGDIIEYGKQIGFIES